MNMIFQSANSFVLAALVAGVVLPITCHAKTCLMIYQLADNNLEFYIRNDYGELASSPVISSPDLRTWIYFDALNAGGRALPNTVDISGQPEAGIFTGSRYITYDSVYGKMRVDMEIPGEVNSDTPDSIQAFLDHALSDCMAQGYDSLFAIFSSHGGGFAGFGGDENARRQLLQTNANIASAIRSSLDTAGGPSKLQVLGFDACLMQAIGAADDYRDVADYILASEAVEPGHGWAYSKLSSAGTAIELAGQILNNFLTETQGGSSHQAPKTLAIVDTALFATFVTALENFSTDLLSLLQAGDVSLHSFVSRSRASSVAFESIVDATGSTSPSGLDIGSWLEAFKGLCNPGEQLLIDLDAAINAYNSMFYMRGVGPGTFKGTGMEITWPQQGVYTANTALWNQVLFQNENYVTQIIPNFRAFLQWFLSSGTPSGGDGTSVCGKGAEVPRENADEPSSNDLIIEDSGTTDSTTGLFDLTATIAPAVSQMLVEYGIDLSTPLKPVLQEKGYTPTDDEYLYLLGGDVSGAYDGNTFRASWDQNFYFLNITGSNTYEALYVFDQGDGSRKIPAMYFPEANKDDVAGLQFLDFLFFDFDHWIAQGAKWSFLQFSVNETEGRVNDNLSLFISHTAGVFAEQPRSAGGYLIPIVYIDAKIQGRELTTLPGGFNQTVIPWTETLGYNVLKTPALNIFDVIPSTDAVVVNMYAYDHGNATRKPDVRRYDVKRQRGAPPGSLALESTLRPGTSSSTTGGQTIVSRSTTGSNSGSPTTLSPTLLSTLAGLTMGMGFLFN